MSDAVREPELLTLAREAFLLESGAALCRKYDGVDPLFTPGGYGAYVDDLLARMTNPFLGDEVERVTRDTGRKLGWTDRFIGTMRLAFGQGIEPARFALGAAAALRQQAVEDGVPVAALLDSLWAGQNEAERHQVVSALKSALSACS